MDYFRKIKIKDILSPITHFESAIDIIRSSKYIRKYKSEFNQIKYFCLFVGHPRSGTSLVGSMLDAHPNMIVAHEMDIIKYFKVNFPIERIFGMIISNSLRKSAQNERKGGGYNNKIQSGWQGKIQNLNVMGDKKAGLTSLRLGNQPDLIAKIERRYGINFKFIHVLRNPFDIITTMSLRSGLALPETIENYIDLACCVNVIKENVPEKNYFTIALEDLIYNPSKTLTSLCQFLNQEAPQFFINACSKRLFQSPKKTRKYGEWNKRNITLFYNGVLENKLDFLYSFKW